MTRNMKDNCLGDKEEEVRKVFIETMEGQFEHDLYTKSFSNKLEPDETDTLPQRINGGWWLLMEEN